MAGQVPQAVVEENLRYYDQYLTDEAAKGKTMHEVLEELGDPRLIAKSIIDANGGGSDMAGIYEDDSRSYGTYQDNEDIGQNSFHRVQFSGFWAMVLLVAVLCLVFVVIGTIIGGIFLILRPILVPLLLIWLVYWIFRRPRY